MPCSATSSSGSKGYGRRQDRSRWVTFNNLKLRPFFMRRCSIFQFWIHRRLTGGLVAGGGGAEAIRGSGRKGRAAGGYKGSHINQYISPELHSMPSRSKLGGGFCDGHIEKQRGKSGVLRRNESRSTIIPNIIFAISPLAVGSGNIGDTSNDMECGICART